MFVSNSKKIIISFTLIFILIIVFFISYFFSFYPIKYVDEVKKFSKKYNLNVNLVLSLINTESGFNRYAKSKVGAMGLMQLMPLTAREIAKNKNIKEYDLYNININLDFGCYYLNYLLNYYNKDLFFALCAYNAGLSNVDSWCDNNQLKSFDVNSIPYKETKKYVDRILKGKNIYKVIYNLN